MSDTPIDLAEDEAHRSREILKCCRSTLGIAPRGGRMVEFAGYFMPDPI